MSLLQSGPRLVARSMETTTQSDVSIGREVEPGNGKKMFTGSDVDVFIDGTRIGRVTPVALAPDANPDVSLRLELRDLHGNVLGKMVDVQHREPEKASGLGTIPCADAPRPPSHWPPRITRLCLSVRLGITRLLLERKA
jgi:hypothetical protein